MTVLTRPASDELAELEPRAEQEEVDCWPPFEWPAQPLRVEIPPGRELLKLRLLIVAAAGSLVGLLIWMLSPQRVGDPIVYAGLTLAVALRAICWLFEWYNYWSIDIPRPLKPRRRWTVDILTTACPGEPRGMIVRTLRSMVAVRYPHTNYLCDEGNDPVLKRVCDELGVIHITRKEKTHAKAGNINNALRQATGQLAVVLDPDHEPSPYLLDRTLGYFEDPAVGFVQSVQAYRNQRDSIVARGAAEQSYHFYGPYMMGMHGSGTTQAIGANCVFRRAALDSICGHAPGLAEDMHTSMRLYSKGWRSVYVPEILTRGLVPSTLAAFYKQQLKWACGVFDLLFQEYPKLFRGFTLRQKFHYLVCPVFFLRGFTTLLEMTVPIACLALGLVAWRATLPAIAASFAPMIVLSTLVRLRAQRWLMEPHERGMHFAGGLLAIATWWIYVAGVICAVCRIKIPYIPTPKEDEPSNAGRILLPNAIAVTVLIVGASVGTYLDSSPSAILMAAFALVNALALLCISITAQQVTLLKLRCRLRPLADRLHPVIKAKRMAGMLYRALLGNCREGWALPGAIALAAITIYWAAHFHRGNYNVETPFELNKDSDVGGFYTGVHVSGASASDSVANAMSLQGKLDFQFRIVAFDQAWGSQVEFPTETFKRLRRGGAVPMMNWLPIGDHPSGQAAQPQPIMKSIAGGACDDYIRNFAASVRAFGEPVLICFAPQPDNPAMPWSSRDGNTADDFIRAWRHIVRIFDTEGASNAGWVWTPGSAENANAYFPGESGEGYVDWIGLPIARDATTLGTSFAQQYAAFHSQVGTWHLPIMLTDLNSGADVAGAKWMSEALNDIAQRCPEIKAVVFDDERGAAGAAQPTASALGDATPLFSIVNAKLKSQPFSAGGATSQSNDGPLWFDLHPTRAQSRNVAGGPEHFSLMVDGKPFYIKGIAYNPGHDWRDADVPLSGRQLNSDFEAIQDLGGNTIRRYGQTWSDRNIFNAAANHQLKVLYGFWFMQDVNYQTDTAKEQEYQQQIESTVLTYRHNPGLLGWCLGNEVWGLLKHSYSQPYLTEVRHAHVLFVERMARRIRELDPDHPIFCAQESSQIAGAISDYAVGAPSLDAVSVNSYYDADIKKLHQIIPRIDPLRPYLVSEFGPDGYWEDNHNHYDRQKGLLEATALEKAALYADRWREDIEAHAGQNVGGIAYCWSDRYEGTATWFGMTDLDGRSKPACAAIGAAWKASNIALRGQFPYAGPKILDVSYPTYAQWPREPFVVKARIQSFGSDRPEIRWDVTGPNFMTDIARITPLEGGDMASIELPDVPGWYRIQLKVIGIGGLDEANVPVFVQGADDHNSIPVTREAYAERTRP